MKKISIAIICLFSFNVFFSFTAGPAFAKEKRVLLKVPICFAAAGNVDSVFYPFNRGA